MCLVDIAQNMRQTGEIPQELRRAVLVLIPKGTMDTWGIGLLETFWKMIAVLIDTRLRVSLQFHDVLHGFRVIKEIGTTITELKLAKELTIMSQDSLLLVLLELRKSYDTVGR